MIAEGLHPACMLHDTARIVKHPTINPNLSYHTFPRVVHVDSDTVMQSELVDGATPVRVYCRLPCMTAAVQGVRAKGTVSLYAAVACASKNASPSLAAIALAGAETAVAHARRTGDLFVMLTCDVLNCCVHMV